MGAVGAATFAMLCVSCTDEQTPFGGVGGKLGQLEHTEMLFHEEETLDGACMVAFHAQSNADATSSEDYIFLIYSADSDKKIRQKISFKFDREDTDVLKEIYKITGVSSASDITNDDGIITIKMDKFEISPVSINILAEDSNKRIWELEAIISIEDMPLGGFAKIDNLEIQLQGQAFQTYRLDYSGSNRDAVNSCLDSSYYDAAYYTNLQ